MSHFLISISDEITLSSYSAASPVHLYANYLFRTDPAQKDTNSDTRMCFAVFPDCDSPVVFTDSLETRKEVKKIFIDALKNICKKFNIDNINTARCYKKIRTFNVDFFHENGEAVKKRAGIPRSLVIDSMKDTLNKIGKHEKVIPLCCVCHIDQGDVHYHVVYFVKPGARGVKSIHEILSAPDEQ